MRARLLPVVVLSLAAAVGAFALWPNGAAAQSSSASDLNYTAVTPCRIADTRVAGGSLAVGTPRDLRVTGTALQAQGGNAAGCNIPATAKAVMFNFVAVNPTGAGNLKAWAYSTPTVGPPGASILNYAFIPGSGLNIANGIAVPICDTAAGACAFDLRVQADVAGTHLVVDVVGYFAGGRRYIVEAGPAQVGHVVALDVATMDLLCRDKDGCAVSLQMINWNAAGEPGSVAAREARLFLSETSRWWRFTNDVTGLDNNGVVTEWAVFDCFFTDAETWTGTPNGRADPAVGLALLNVAGGTYNDATTVCRVVVDE